MTVDPVHVLLGIVHQDPFVEAVEEGRRNADAMSRGRVPPFPLVCVPVGELPELRPHALLYIQRHLGLCGPKNSVEQ